jgi:putative ABC transport system permease protein
MLAGWMALTPIGRQAWSVTRTGIATLPQRSGPSAVIVVGIAGVVGVFVALLAMGSGLDATLKQTGSDDTAIIVSAGAQSEPGSYIPNDSAAIIGHAPQILRNAGNHPIFSPEIAVVATLPKRNKEAGRVTVRGVGPQALALRPRLRLIEGRAFQPGLYELIAGKNARKQLADIGVGSTLMINNQSWTVVGLFDSGDAHDSELWGDADAIASAFRRGSAKTSITVKLTDPSTIDGLRAYLASDPRLRVDVATTREFYGRQSAAVLRMTRILGIAVGTIMAIGAIFGALNAMYSAVAARARETATLRAIGFNRVPVVVSVLLETMALAVLGGIGGALIAWTVFDGFTASTLANASQLMFEFEVSPSLLWEGLKWALAIGFVGGVFPAVRAARMPIISGLREL